MANISSFKGQIIVKKEAMAMPGIKSVFNKLQDIEDDLMDYNLVVLGIERLADFKEKLPGDYQVTICGSGRWNFDCSFDMLLADELGEKRFLAFTAALADYGNKYGNDGLQFSIEEYECGAELLDTESGYIVYDANEDYQLRLDRVETEDIEFNEYNIIESGFEEGYKLKFDDPNGKEFIEQINESILFDKLAHPELEFRKNDYVDRLIDSNFEKFDKKFLLDDLRFAVRSSLIMFVLTSDSHDSGILTITLEDPEYLFDSMVEAGYLKDYLKQVPANV